MVVDERIGLDVVYKASTIGEAPLLRPALPRSDGYVEVQMRARKSRRGAPVEEEPPREQERKSRQYIIFIVVLVCVVASCSLAISLLVLRGTRETSRDADQSSSAASNPNVPSDISTTTFAPSGPTLDLQPPIQSPPTKLPTQPPMQSSGGQQPTVPQLPISSLPPTPAFPPNPLTIIVGASPRPTISAALQPTDAAFSVVLASGSSLSRTDVIYSPNGLYSFVMEKENGDLILLRDDDEVLWRAEGDGAETCHMQPDGNFLLRKSDRATTWKSGTSGNRGAYLILDREGQLAIVSGDASMSNPSRLWFTGMP
jgi:hypothetical protein